MSPFNKLLKKRNLKYELVKDNNGIHQIGGELPEDFIIPENEFIAGFQYLGFIDNKDQLFSWLPFKVNLIHPIYTDEYYVFLDYTDPKRPAIIEPTDSSMSTSAFDEIDKHSTIAFEAVTVSAIEKEVIDEFEYIGICGEPSWLQGAAIPSCPKSGKVMKFLCQLGSFNKIKKIKSNIIPKNGNEIYFDQMNFWCDGNLYIFIEPTSRTICYTMQNT